MTARTLPTLPTFTTGQALTSSEMNQIITYIGFLSSPPMFRMYQATAQTLTTSTFTQITCDTSVWDTDSGRQASTPWNYVVPFAGRWTIRGCYIAVGNATGGRVAAIYQNGTAVPASSVPGTGVTGVNNGAFAECTVTCNVGDTLGLWGYQASGGNLATGVSGQMSFFEGQLESLASP
jgi:hypothetical protein